MQTFISLDPASVSVENGGFFISSGRGAHPERVLSSYEVIFVASGTLGIYEGDDEYSVTENHAVILRPQRRHGGLAPYPADLRFYWVHFTADAVGGGSMISPPLFSRAGRPERLFELFRNFLADQSAARKNQLSMNNLMTAILCEIADYGGREPDARPDRLSSAVKTFIDTNFSRAVSTADIAREFGYNADYLGRIFRKSRGKTIMRDLNEARIGYACRLLFDSSETISRIAPLCGYNDRAYFCRVFKEIKGVSPSKYRLGKSALHVNTE